ncbi:MAG: pentapeptide repeat-containing protein [Okeania sp. SIO1I7]|nr:pentapeptide repeat-containing protein [Okeania sp. SIO1I7]
MQKLPGDKLVFAIAGSIDTVDEAKLQAIIGLLQKISGDTDIKIVGKEKGSIRLILQGSEAGLAKLKELYESGKLTEVLGTPVEDVHFLSEETEAKSSSAELHNNQEILVQKIRSNKKDGLNLAKADLSGADLSDADLSGTDLSGTDLSGADLSGADLSDANLSGADLSGADLSDADLSDADLSDAILSDTILSGAILSGAKLRGTDILISLFSIDEVKKLASHQNINVPEVDNLLDEVEEILKISISEKYKIMFYLAMVNLYEVEEIAKITRHSYKNIHSDFNKNLGQYLKEYFYPQSQPLRFGITSLRRTVFSLDKKYFYRNNKDDLINILSNRLKENSDVNKDLKVEENIHDIHGINYPKVDNLLDEIEEDFKISKDDLINILSNRMKENSEENIHDIHGITH